MKRRFTTKYKQNGLSLSYRVFVDKETGVNYLYVSHVQGAGLTPLLDQEGKPIITREDIK